LLAWLSDCEISTLDKTQAEWLDLKLGKKVRVSYFVNKFKTEVACTIAPAKPSK
jgi:hypothetical protein